VKERLRPWLALAKSTVSSWLDDYAPSMGAALSYYTVFSLAPLLLIVVSVAGLVFGEQAVRGELFGQLQALMGADAAQAVQSLLASASRPVHGVIGTAVGIAVLVFGATTVFGELQDDLDRIWRAPPREGVGWWSLLRARLLSFGMILALAFLLMVSLVVGAVISALGKWWQPMFGGWEVLAQLVNLVVGFALTTAIFAIIYKMMPRVHVRWHDVWIGAVVTALLFTVGKFLIGLYIGKSGVASGFGAAGSLIVVFLWVYYSAQVFLLGAEFTSVYARARGSMQEGGAAEDAAAQKALEAEQRTPTRSGTGARESVAAEPPDRTLTPAGAADPAKAGVRMSLRNVGAGVAVLLAMRFVLPRLLRRL
jgi:membrane protein